jgi:ABC-2 type transport system permease protein
MNGFCSVFKREFKSYFTTPLAYVFLVIFLAFSAFMTFNLKRFFDAGQASLEIFFGNMPMLFIFLAPAIAMRLWAEERRSHSIELLFTLPLTTPQAVLGKFFAAWGVIAAALALTAPMVYTVFALGEPDPGPIVTGYLGSLLLSGCYLAIGSFFSGLTRNQVIAFVLSVVVCGAVYYLSSPALVRQLDAWLPGGFAYLLERLSFATRFESMQRGVLELRDMAFFVLMGAGWLWANIVVLEERKAD